MTKKMVERKVGELDVNYSTAAYIKEQLDNFIAEYGDKIEFQLEQEDCCDSYEVNAYVQAEETDEEYAARLKNEAYYTGIP